MLNSLFVSELLMLFFSILLWLSLNILLIFRTICFIAFDLLSVSSSTESNFPALGVRVGVKDRGSLLLKSDFKSLAKFEGLVYIEGE
jgi:hypothetical protein